MAEVYQIPENQTEVYTLPAKYLSPERQSIANELLNLATGSDTNFVNTEEDMSNAFEDFKKQEQQQRQVESEDYLASEVANGNLTPQDYLQTLQGLKEQYVDSATVEDAASRRVSEDPISGEIDEITKKTREIAYVDQQFAAKVFQDVEDTGFVRRAGGWIATNVYTPLGQYIKNHFSPKDQELALTPSGFVEATVNYWNSKADKETTEQYKKDLFEYYQFLKDSNCPVDVMKQIAETLTTARNRTMEAVDNAVGVLDLAFPVGSFARTLAKGGTVGAATLNALEYTIPGITIPYKLGKAGVTAILKDGKALALSEAEALKQAGEYGKASEALLKTSKAEEVLSETAPMTREFSNANKGTDLAGTTETLTTTKAWEMFTNNREALTGIKEDMRQTFEKWLNDKWIEPFLKTVSWKQNTASLVEAFEDGSGGIVRLTNNGKYWKSHEEASRAIQDLVKKNEVSANSLRKLGILDRMVTPVRIAEGKGKGKFAIHLILKTPESMLDTAVLKTFPTYEAATKAIQKAKATEYAKVVKNSDNSFGVVPTTDKVLPTSLTGAPTDFTKGFLKNLMSSVGTKSSWRTLALSSIRDGDKMHAIITDYIKPFFKGLSDADAKDLNKFYKISSANRMYLSDTELIQRGASQKTIDAYHALRDVNDLMYLVDSAFDRASRVAAGQKSVLAFGKPVAFGKRLDVARIKNPSLYKWVLVKGDEAKTVTHALKEYPPESYEYIKLEVPKKGSQYWIMPKDEVTFAELPAFPNRYVPGFRHLYGDDTLFIKMACPVRNEDGEIVDIGYVTTIAGAKDYNKAVEAVEEYNKAYQIVCNNTPEAMSELKGPLGAMKFEDLKSYFNDLGVDINKDNVFEILKDGEIPKAFKTAKLETVEGSENLHTFASGSVRGLNETEANIIARKRDIGLLDVEGGLLDTVDFNTLLATMIDNITSTVGIKEYRRIAGEDFYRTFKDLLDPHEVSTMSPYQLLLYGTLKDGPNVRAAEAAQAQARVICGVPTKLDVAINRLWNNFKDDILAKHFPEYIGGKIDTALTDAPIKGIKGIRTVTFQLLLGCLNPAPFFQNVLSSSIAVSISPMAGMKALQYTPKLMGLIGKTLDAEALKALTAEERAILQYIDKLPIHGQALEYSGYANDISLKWKKIQSFLAAPFSAGEKFVRTHAAITAALEAFERQPELWKDVSKATTKDLQRSMDRMDTLYNRMSRASVAPIQRGMIGSIAFQMLGYQMRVWDSLLTSKLSAAEKARMVAFATILTGTEGVLGKNVMSNVYSAVYGDNSNQEPDEFYEALSKGLPTLLFQAATGVKLDIMSPINWNLEEIAKPFVNLVNPDNTVAGTKFVGAAGIVADAVALTNKTLFGDVSISESVRILPQMVGQSLLENQLIPTSLSRLYRAWTMMKVGEMQSLSGQAMAQDVGTGEALGYFFFGSAVSDADTASMFRKIIKDKRMAVKFAAASASPFYERFRADPSSENYRDFTAALHVSTSKMSDSDKVAVLESVSKTSNISYEALREELIRYGINVKKEKR